MAGSAIATPHHVATSVGADVLAEGGTAVDAALAAAAALCVTYPNNVALGSDLVALVRDPGGRTVCVNATGWSPSGLSLETLRRRYGDSLPLRGVDTVTVPGAVRGWEELHRRGGRLPWARLVEPAVVLAREGSPVPASVVRSAARAEADLRAGPGCWSLVAPTGVPLGEGELLRQPELAETLAAVARHGPDELYTGEVAHRWVDGLRALGSALTPEDVAAYRAEVTQPLIGEVAGRTVLTSPPNTQGFALIRSLAALGADVRLDGDQAAEAARVFAGSNRVRDAWLADPRHASLDVAALLDPTREPATEGPAAPAASGDTVGIAAVSEDGWAVSLIQSLFHGFGACVREPTTGILFQNRGTSFSLDPRSPNAFAPRKRPRHTLMPVLVETGGRLGWVSSTMGGQGQPQIHAQVLLRAFAGATPEQAVGAPRFVVGPPAPGVSVPTVAVEADVAAEAVGALQAAEDLGVEIVPSRDDHLGHTNLVAVSPDGSLLAASDPRSDGSARLVGLRTPQP